MTKIFYKKVKKVLDKRTKVWYNICHIRKNIVEYSEVRLRHYIDVKYSL